MGGGSSKQETVKNKAAQQGTPEHDAFANYAGPAKGGQSQSTIESPVKKSSKAPVPGQTDDYEPDDQRPAAIAKQVRMSQASMGSLSSPPQKSAKQLEVEKHAKFQIELQKSQQQAKQREVELKKEREEQQAKKAKVDAENEKIRQLQMLKEQQKAKEAAKRASEATSQQQYIQQSQGSEVFAQHNSPGTGSMNKSMGRSDIMSSQGTMGNMNSPMKSQKQMNLNGQKQNQYGMDGLQVNGRGLQRDDSFQQFEQHHVQQKQKYQAAQSSIQFKVINYNEEAAQQKKRDYDDGGYGYSNATKYKKHADSGIHIGMEPKEYHKDAEQNRNIDMAELNELLGI